MLSLVSRCFLSLARRKVKGKIKLEQRSRSRKTRIMSSTGSALSMRTQKQSPSTRSGICGRHSLRAKTLWKKVFRILWLVIIECHQCCVSSVPPSTGQAPHPETAPFPCRFFNFFIFHFNCFVPGTRARIRACYRLLQRSNLFVDTFTGIAHCEM